ncbi:MAG: PIN domain-containing protein [Spirochaetales bacterium]|nr:PIN domain-containing protein [Spirochaetales bacterium]MCF7939477.1 PIN domain-containing protein [Spirochaetales bacterium]
MIYLDTHVVVWIYQKERDRFSRKGQELIETEDLIVSPFVELEIEYLFEIEKIRDRSTVILDYLRKQIALKISEVSFSEVIKKAGTLKWTRDPFDRIIIANAAVQDIPLLTKDRKILTHYPKALW